jgi:hypothetical protein
MSPSLSRQRKAAERGLKMALDALQAEIDEARRDIESGCPHALVRGSAFIRNAASVREAATILDTLNAIETEGAK